MAISYQICRPQTTKFSWKSVNQQLHSLSGHPVFTTFPSIPYCMICVHTYGIPVSRFIPCFIFHAARFCIIKSGINFCISVYKKKTASFIRKLPLQTLSVSVLHPDSGALVPESGSQHIHRLSVRHFSWTRFLCPSAGSSFRTGFLL